MTKLMLIFSSGQNQIPTIPTTTKGHLVIDHGNWGKVSRLKWHLLLNANCWSKQQHTVITTSSQPFNE